MTKAFETSDRLPARPHFWLAQISTFLAALGVSHRFVDPFDLGDAPLRSIGFSKIHLFFIHVPAFFLMVARFMRNNYAECFWPRTLAIPAHAATGPFRLNWGVMLLACIGNEAIPQSACRGRLVSR